VSVLSAVVEKFSLRERADSIVCLDAAVFVIDCNAFIAVGDVGDDGVEHQSRVILFQERIRFADDKGVEAPRVEDIVVLLRVLVEGCILSSVH